MASSEETVLKWASTALALTSEDWDLLGSSCNVHVDADGGSSEEVRCEMVEGMTSLLLMRIAAVIGASTFRDLSTTCVARSLLLRGSGVWPALLTTEVISQASAFVHQMVTGYRRTPYHNACHAYHVTLSVNKLLDLMLNVDHLQAAGSKTPPLFGLRHDPLMHLALLFSAIIHDVEHFGVANRQLTIEGDPLSILYNDQSIQEQRSLYVAFTELLKHQYSDLRNVIFPNTDDYRRFRKAVLNLILTTDIASPERLQVAKSKWKEAFGEATGWRNNHHHAAIRRNSLVSEISQHRLSRNSMNKRASSRRGSTQSMGSVLDDSSNDESSKGNLIVTTQQQQYQNLLPEETCNHRMMRRMSRRASGQSMCSVVSELTLDFGMGYGERFFSRDLDAELDLDVDLAADHDDHDDADDEDDTGYALTPDQSEHLQEEENLSDDNYGDDDGEESMSQNNHLPSSTTLPNNNNNSHRVVSNNNPEEYGYESPRNARRSFNRRVGGTFRRNSIACVPEELGSNVHRRMQQPSTTMMDPPPLSSDAPAMTEGGMQQEMLNQQERDLYDQLYAPAGTTANPRKKQSNTVQQRRFSCSTTIGGGGGGGGRSVSSVKFRKRLSILRSVDLSGESIETYSRASNGGGDSVFGGGRPAAPGLLDADEPNELRATVVMETIMVASDVAHNLQGWEQMKKWSSQLYHELKKAFDSGRGEDPSKRWFDNQITFLESYLLPLAHRMGEMGVFGNLIGPWFARVVEQNRDRWLVEGAHVTAELLVPKQKQPKIGQ